MHSPFEEPSLQLAEAWYQEVHPWVFDQASFDTFLSMNEPILTREGLLMRLRDRLYVINPYFDNYVRINLSFGVLSKIMTARCVSKGLHHD